jgi:rhodanese-related sulfurtransferase
MSRPSPDPRQVHPGLYVGSLAARGTTGDYGLVIDCHGAPATPCGCPVAVAIPKGRMAHTWSAADLDSIVSLVVPVLHEGGSVLIHCRRGVSRSATAAAAVLLQLGLADDVDAAVAAVRHPTRRPASASAGSLRSWWLQRTVPEEVLADSLPEGAD